MPLMRGYKKWRFDERKSCRPANASKTGRAGVMNTGNLEKLILLPADGNTGKFFPIAEAMATP